jgi:hypothetical protein
LPNPKLKPLDATGRRIAVGDVVRVLAVPNLEGMSRHGMAESRPVFEHIVGTYKRVIGFGRYGHVELMFRIRAGRSAGLHIVELEPSLTRVRRPSRQRTS